jgi:hypothetical protein
MLFHGSLDAGALTVTLRPQSVTAGVGTRLVAASARGARLFSVFRDGHTFRRGLNGLVLHKWSDARGRHWDLLAAVEADALLDECAGLFARVADEVRRGAVRPARAEREGAGRDASDPELVAALERAAASDAAAGRRDAARFAEVYRPIGILPPDQYLALVLQATEGCSFNSCTFCDLYRERYRVKGLDEFTRHVLAVRKWLGDSLALRGRSVFLGAANALAVPTPRLLSFLDVVGREIAPPRGVAAFVDGFTGVRKEADEYGALVRRGLRRIYVGLESGHDALLAFVQKPASRAEAVATVRAAKAGGVAVAVIVMVGLGGDRFADDHVRETVAALNEMALSGDDLVYISDFVGLPGTAYPRLAAEAGIRALDAAGRAAQRAAIVGGLRPWPGGPRAVRYDVREFVY